MPRCELRLLLLLPRRLRHHKYLAGSRLRVLENPLSARAPASIPRVDVVHVFAMRDASKHSHLFVGAADERPLCR